MQVILNLDDAKYPVNINIIVNKDGEVKYVANFMGSPISTYRYYQKYEGSNMEAAIALVAKELRRALSELQEI